MNYFASGTPKDGVARRLKSLGLKLEENSIVRNGLWPRAYLRDPNGNRICLFHAGENRKNPLGRVT
ncbi:MAG: hypothetical protein ABIR33_04725 [Pyrinomonadaceae bacterium]